MEIKRYAQMVENRLNAMIPQPESEALEIGGMPWTLASSMRYSLTAGGKHLRASMFLCAVELLGGSVEDNLDFACAIEMIHTYSLIHDDLPGMDDDTLRRGKPTNHVVFGEGQAILAGDGLLNLAFETMLSVALRAEASIPAYTSAIAEIAKGCGVTGMIAGQSVDLYAERKGLSDDAFLEYIQRGKTACMFEFPLRAAARICAASDAVIDALGRFGRCYGLMFQARDDLLDVVGDEAQMGKTLGKDADSQKLTCVSRYGIEGTRERIAALYGESLQALGEIDGDTSAFEALAAAEMERSS